MKKYLENLLFICLFTGIKSKKIFSTLFNRKEKLLKLRDLKDTKNFLESCTRKKIDEKKVNFYRIKVEKIMGEISLGKYGVITFLDENYPHSLLDVYIPPILLFYKGNSSLLKREKVAVVGTRRASKYGKKVAEDLSEFLSTNGICVVSGLARGIDKYAHIGALNGEGSTIAVLGNGIKNFYPPENKNLQLRIFEKGLVLSEFPPGEKPYFYNFPIRNRILSGLSTVVVVVEADLRSGAIITANYALEQGKDVLAVPGSIFSRPSKGTNKMILDGAYPLISIEDILNFVKIDNFKVKGRYEEDNVELTEEEKGILKLFYDMEGITLDYLVENSSLSIPSISEILFSLELKGVVESIGNFYRLKEYNKKYE